MHKHSSTKKTSWVKDEIAHEVTRWKPPQFIHNLQYATFVREDYKDGLLTPEQHYSNQTLVYLLPGNNSSEINKLSGIATGYHWSHHRQISLTCFIGDKRCYDITCYHDNLLG